MINSLLFAALSMVVVWFLMNISSRDKESTRGTPEQRARYKQLVFQNDPSEENRQEIVKLYQILYPEGYKQHMDYVNRRL